MKVQDTAEIVPYFVVACEVEGNLLFLNIDTWDYSTGWDSSPVAAYALSAHNLTDDCLNSYKDKMPGGAKNLRFLKANRTVTVVAEDISSEEIKAIFEAGKENMEKEIKEGKW